MVNTTNGPQMERVSRLWMPGLARSLMTSSAKRPPKSWSLVSWLVRCDCWRLQITLLFFEAHGKVLSVLLSIILDDYSHANPIRGLTNTSVTHVEYDPVKDMFALVAINCTRHLLPPASI